MCYHLVRALPTTLDGEEKERCHEERFSAVARAEKRSLGACVRAWVAEGRPLASLRSDWARKKEKTMVVYGLASFPRVRP